MWVLFGINYNTVENEPLTYFIGIFDDLLKLKNEINRQITENKIKKGDLFVKDILLNQSYDFEWQYCTEDVNMDKYL